jgi:hypothetical protein
MFPVDSIKVRPRFPVRAPNAHFTLMTKDTYASIRYFASGGIYGDRQRVHANIFYRGCACTMAGRVVGDSGGRSSACCSLWNV